MRPPDIVIGEVPCNGCTACCHGDAVRLLPQDDPDEYITEPHDYMIGRLMLAHKSNGDCIYLGGHGCTIHDRRPQMCRQMDCRLIAMRLPKKAAKILIKQKRLQKDVYERGRELLKQL